ncbi:MAG: TolC family outer membrane protein [Gallionella sp.]|nr:TolC family outer membrane protein [Gallionella sp.]
MQLPIEVQAAGGAGASAEEKARQKADARIAKLKAKMETKAEAERQRAEQKIKADAEKQAAADIQQHAEAEAVQMPVSSPEMLVERWVKDWAEKNVGGYLSHYDVEFRPENGKGREGWEAKRRSRIGEAASIKVHVDNLKIERQDELKATARFVETIEVGSYKKTSQKQLLLVRRDMDSDWRIREEREETKAESSRVKAEEIARLEAEANASKIKNSEKNKAEVSFAYAPASKEQFDGVDWSDQKFWLVEMPDMLDRDAVTAAWRNLRARFPKQMENRAILPRRQGVKGGAGEEPVAQYQLFIANFPEKQVADELCAMLRVEQQRCSVVPSQSLAGKDLLNATLASYKGSSNQNTQAGSETEAALLKPEQEAQVTNEEKARQAAEARIAKLKAAQEAKAEMARQKAAQKAKAEAEKQSAAEEKARQEEEARVAKLKAKEEAKAEAEKQDLAESEAAKLKTEQLVQAEAEPARLNAEQEAEEKARQAAEARIAKLKAEQEAKAETVRQKAAQKAKTEADKQAAAEEKARQATEARVAKLKAKAEAARLKAEQAAKAQTEKQALAEVRAEAARQKAEQQAKVQAEKQAAAEEEKARQEAEQAAKAQAEKQDLAEAEAARLKTEQLVQAEVEPARLNVEQKTEEKARQEAETRVVKLKAKAEAARLKAEQEAEARAKKQALAEAKAEAARQKAEQQAKAVAEKQALAEEKARQEAEVKAAKLKVKEEAKAEAARLKAEQTAKVQMEKLAAAEVKQAEQQAQAVTEVEPVRLNVEQEAEEKARQVAEAKIAKLKAREEAKAEAARQKAEHEAEVRAKKQALAEDKAETARQKAAQKTKAAADKQAAAEAKRAVKAEAVRLKAELEAHAVAEEKVALLKTGQEARAAVARADAENKGMEEEHIAAEARRVAEAEAVRVNAEKKARADTPVAAEAETKAVKPEVQKGVAEDFAENVVRLKAEQKAKAEAQAATEAKAAKLKAARSDMLVDFVQKAVLTNPDVLSRWHTFKAAISETTAARGGYLPRVDMTVDRGRERGQSQINNYTSNTENITFTLTQMLYDGFATRNEVSRLNNAQLARYYELLDASETAALEAARVFYDVTRHRKLFELTEDNYVRHRTAFEQIKLKVEAGVGRRVDLEQAGGRLALSESNLTVDNANVHDVSARFQRVIGELPPANLRKSPSQGKLAKQVLPNAAAAVLSVAVDYHPAILAAVENVRSARYDLYGRWAKYQPTVNLSIAQTHSKNLAGVDGATGNATAKVTLNWNLFSGGSDSARSTQYAGRLDAARDLRDKACRDIRMNLAIAYNDIWKLQEQLNYLDQHQLSIEKARGAYQKQFDIGQRSLLDLLDTENELYQAKRSYVNAEYDLAIAHTRTLAGMGRLVSSLGIAHLETAELPELLGISLDAPESCPPEAPIANNIRKDELDARAIEEAKAAIEATRAKAEAEKEKKEAEDKEFMMTPGEARAAKLKEEQDAKAGGVEPARPKVEQEPEKKVKQAVEPKAAKKPKTAKVKEEIKVEATVSRVGQKAKAPSSP